MIQKTSRSCSDKIRTAVRIQRKPFTMKDIFHATGCKKRTVKSRLWDMVQSGEIKVIKKIGAVNVYTFAQGSNAEQAKSYYKPNRNRRPLQADILDRIRDNLPGAYSEIRKKITDVAPTVLTKHFNHLRKTGEIISKEGYYERNIERDSN